MGAQKCFSVGLVLAFSAFCVHSQSIDEKIKLDTDLSQFYNQVRMWYVLGAIMGGQKCFFLGLLITFSGFGVHLCFSPSLIEKLTLDVEFAQFYNQLERSKLANVTLQYKQATIFAPINEAFQRMEATEANPDDLVLYHMTSIPRKTTQLGTSYTSMNSELEGNPPLWITHTTGNYHNDIYVNNARLLVSHSDIMTTQKNGNIQVVHKIDEVLVPTRSAKNAQHRVYNPTAYEFLEYYESLIFHPHRLRYFRQKVQQHSKQDIFKTEGGHTFFIPVDEGFKNKRAELIDGKIIDGHVIPKHVLFTRPTKKDVPFQTLANGDNNVRVVISFTQETRGPNNQVINYVKSHTLLSDGKHSQGVVLSEIVKANIPVKNGVVHLIQKPLMVVDNNVRELLEQYKEKDGGILSSFVKAINDADYREFYNTLERSQDITLFAPCNNAWTDDFTLNSIISNKNRFKDILMMHLVPDNRLYVDRILSISHGRDKRVHTRDPRNDLYFNVVTSGTNRTVTVEGGGVNATVIQPDLAATNGIIHVIDRVLGVPYTTVYDKLRTDYSLNYTFRLGNQGGFNNQLSDTTKKFTYFVPRNQAWDEASVDHPSAIKKLFMPEFHYHATNILERHLVISDEPYTMERIKQLTLKSNQNMNNYERRTEIQLPTIRGELNLYVEELQDHNDPLVNKTFIIHWKGERIPVFKPNVACTNGVIHVIDAPFLQDGDIRVSGAPSLHFAPHLIMILAAKWLLL
nr:PREDICTED: fasciclin-1 isoform X4 [Tribolium castaneum]|eukprot:XP_015833788.1 PREDICTED: fasciclin-1 isoform X4 [Tribolium castaneum]